MSQPIPIQTLRNALSQQGIRVYLSEYGAIRIETNHYRREMSPAEFLDLLHKMNQHRSF